MDKALIVRLIAVKKLWGGMFLISQCLPYIYTHNHIVSLQSNIVFVDAIPLKSPERVTLYISLVQFYQPHEINRGAGPAIFPQMCIVLLTAWQQSCFTDGFLCRMFNTQSVPL
jgi:hypothetical protein